ncbi:hypothetical protein ACFSMW_14225 [Virgibacillus halophilus]|uniref:WYL domain-containing protein n=1 Tax=Tigheibacillus halophilus TaxID=361280 RepID=A0ABU5C201_9BACI|nr:hypothetical protein [Virgibacillus halophilus]
MKKQLVQAMKTAQTLLIYYVDGDGHITERYIRVLEVKNNYITAYCFWRKKVRTFSISGILTAGRSGKRVI